MSGVEPTDMSADEAATAAQVEFDRVGVVTKVYPHTSNGDGRTGGVDVKTVAGNSERFSDIPVAAGFSGETRLPRVGQPVIVRWLKSDPPYPYVAQAIDTEKHPGPTGRAGTWAIETGGARAEVARDGSITLKTGGGAALTLDGSSVNIEGQNLSTPGGGPGGGTYAPGGGSKPLPGTSPDSPPEQRVKEAGINVNTTKNVSSLAEISGESNTLYKVDGDLAHNGKHALGTVNNVAIVGTKGSTLTIPSGFTDYSITTTGGRNFMWSGINIDQSADGALGRLNVNLATGGFYEYFKLYGDAKVGVGGGPGPSLHIPAGSPNGRVRMRGVSLIFGGNFAPDHKGNVGSPGIFLGHNDHKGVLRIEDSQIEEFSNNAIYASPASGAVEVKNSRLYNNGVSQYRASSGWLRNSTIGFDYKNSGMKNSNRSGHGVVGALIEQKLDGAGNKVSDITNCKVEMLNVGQCGGGLVGSAAHNSGYVHKVANNTIVMGNASGEAINPRNGAFDIVKQNDIRDT